MNNENKVDVIIISGQSNAVGCSNSSYIGDNLGIDKYFEYNDGYDDIKISYDCWTKDFDPIRYYSQNKSYDNFKPVKLGEGNSISTFGPEIGIAESLHERYANKLYLIKFACGASNLKDDWTHKDSIMYVKLIEFIDSQINILKNMGLDPTIKAFCFMQGEGDSYDGYYQHYYNNLKEFVSNLRNDLKKYSNTNNLPFIDAGISSASPWVYYKEVNDAKKEFASENINNIYIDTISSGLHTNIEPINNPDLCHYDSESEILLGKLFAHNFEKFLSKD